jgi:cytochrome c peroxidase
MRRKLTGAICGLLVIAASLPVATGETQQEPIVPLPLTAQVDPARAALGERLFSDTGLSRDHTIACATCHPLNGGGMDGRAIALRPNSQSPARNTPTIFNVSLNASLHWDGAASTLEDQCDRSLRTVMGTTWPVLLAYLRGNPAYVAAFDAAYAQDVSPAIVLDAIASFERSLVTPRSRFDRYLRGERNALTMREQDGYQRFKGYGCIACHQGMNIGGNMYQRFGIFVRISPGASGTRDEGRFLITHVPRDTGVFRVPSLRNVAVTSPYFHDGRARTLEDAVKTMGRVQLGRALSADDVDAIVAFLQTLTGEYRGRPLQDPTPETP